MNLKRICCKKKVLNVICDRWKAWVCTRIASYSCSEIDVILRTTFAFFNWDEDARRALNTNCRSFSTQEMIYLFLFCHHFKVYYSIGVAAWAVHTGSDLNLAGIFWNLVSGVGNAFRSVLLWVHFLEWDRFYSWKSNFFPFSVPWRRICINLL